MKELFTGLYRLFQRRKILLYLIFLSLLGLFAFLSSQLLLENDLSAMLPKDNNKKDVSSILTNNKMLDRIIASVSIHDTSAVDPDLLSSFTDDFASLLLQNDTTHLIAKVETKQNEEKFLDIIQSVQTNLPFLLDEIDYQKIDSLIAPEQIKTTLASNYRILASPGGMAMKQLIAKDPLGLSYIPLKKLQDVQQDENTTLYNGYIMSNNQKTLTFFIHTTYPASNTKQNEGLTILFNATLNKLLKREDNIQLLDRSAIDYVSICTLCQGRFL